MTIYFHLVPCGNGWYSFNLGCYAIIQELSDYSTAQQSCESFGAHLIDVQTEEEYNFIINVISTDFSAYYYWLGAKDVNQNGEYSWSDGTSLDSTFSIWGEGQPDVLCSEHCVHIRPDFQWNNYGCGDGGWRICEK